MHNLINVFRGELFYVCNVVFVRMRLRDSRYQYILNVVPGWKKSSTQSSLASFERSKLGKMLSVTSVVSCARLFFNPSNGTVREAKIEAYPLVTGNISSKYIQRYLLTRLFLPWDIQGRLVSSSQ